MTIFNQKYLKIQKVGPRGLSAPITTHAKELGIVKGDRVYIYCEEVDGKRKIIIERVD